jgi:hypothetical protein
MQTCNTCKFWRHFINDGESLFDARNFRYCTFRAPRRYTITVPTDKGYVRTFDALWPITHHSQLCGKWRQYDPQTT